eukprot:1261701-Rhodomonas_salina.2
MGEKREGTAAARAVCVLGFPCGALAVLRRRRQDGGWCGEQRLPSNDKIANCTGHIVTRWSTFVAG